MFTTADTAEGLLSAPATAFVAGFIGDAARLPCRVRDGAAHFDPLAVDPLGADLPDGPATAFLRPGEMLVRAGGAGRVRQVRADGEGPVRVVVQLGTLILDAVAAPGEALARGDACRLSPRGGQVFLSGGARAAGRPL